MSETQQNIQAPNTEEPTGGNPEKTFTQDEVNRIVQDRLAKERTKYDPKPDPLAEREAELARREFMFTAREKMTEKGLPVELLEAMNTSSPEAFEKSMETIEQKLYGPYVSIKDPATGEYVRLHPGEPIPPFTTPGTGQQPQGLSDKVREAMGLKR